MTEIFRKIEECANTVYRTLGTGHSEAVYHKALLVELRLNGLSCESEVICPITYKDQFVGHGRADIVVEQMVVVELKALMDLFYNGTHFQKVKAYMKSLKLNQGLMINFCQKSGKIRTEDVRFRFNYADDYLRLDSPVL